MSIHQQRSFTTWSSLRRTHIFLISRLGIPMHPTISGKRLTISLLLMVMFATIFLSAIFLVEKFLSFLPPPLLSSSRSSATLPCEVVGMSKFLLCG